MSEEIKLKKVEYWKHIRPPTLKQFLTQQTFKESAQKTKDATGTTPEGNRIIPQSASQMRDNLKGLSAEEIAKRRPDLVQEWERKYGHR